MEDVFEKEICSICQKKNTNLCKKQVYKRQDKGVIIKCCNDYKRKKTK